MGFWLRRSTENRLRWWQEALSNLQSLEGVKVNVGEPVRRFTEKDPYILAIVEIQRQFLNG